MVILGRWNDQSLTISRKSNSLTVSLTGKRDGATVMSYDDSGRLWTAMQGGVSYRRGLNGAIIAKWKTGSADRQRRWLAESESDALIDLTNRTLRGLILAIDSGTATVEADLSPQLRSSLLRAASFDHHQARADTLAYLDVYQPVGILPPDQYMSVVLQLTEGCSFNTCTFCNFYRDRPFRIKTREQLRAHTEAVRKYLGAGLSLRRTIFLGDANALVVPTRSLLPLVDEIGRVLDIEALGGLYAFLDGFSGERKTAADYAQLAARGLKRVYIGLESGHDPLLRFLHKPGQAADALESVRAMKQAGIAVGVIVLLGAGGRQFAAAHAEETISILNNMPLDADDLIYFSELVESEGLEYASHAYQAGLQPLTPAERIAQGDEIESRLRFTLSGGTPHISRYDIREFVY